MQIKSVLLTSLIAAGASALPTMENTRRALCTPQDNNGFTVRIVSDDELNGKVVSIEGDIAGVDLVDPQSVIWPYSVNKTIQMPGPGYKYSVPGYLYSDDSVSGKQLRFSKDLPTTGTAETEVFTTSCDEQGAFYLAVEYNWLWQACPYTVEGQQVPSWSIYKNSTAEGCREVKLNMKYGPPY